MERIKSLYSEVKSIFLTCFFEMTLQIKKFIIFSSITIVAIILNSYLPYILIPQLQVPNTQVYFYQSGLNTFYLIIIFAVCFFFSGIICSEFRDKTGIIIFPKINKYKLIIGKYLGNLTLVTGIHASLYTLNSNSKALEPRLWKHQIGIYYFFFVLRSLKFQMRKTPMTWVENGK